MAEIRFPTDVNALTATADDDLVLLSDTSDGDNIKKITAQNFKKAKTESLVDDASVVISTGTNGFGFVMIGDNQEYAFFAYSTTAVVLLVDSTNVVNADTDGNLCIFYSGSDLTVRNRLGATLDVIYFPIEG